ncbi:hydrogenase formation protein HypD [Niveibacterium terrae]|uniref:hydrogenase formation protein HypD n=1 Tax=Niveibacterium terrae TaxID=3373598 RepID=UPI003A9105CB
MKFVDEFRAADPVLRCAERIARATSRPWSIMEICGGQTHAIIRNGLDALLPAGLRLLHGPGCPVCVTPVAAIDRAIGIASRPGVIFCSFGDMLRVPGSRESLLEARSRGAELHVVYSPLDALALAEARPDREVVFFAIGFETTAPTSAMAAWQAKRRGVKNFSLLVSQFRVPPAITALLAAPDSRIDGFLAAGHVCAVMGCAEYHVLAARERIPIVVAGFEALDLMQAILACVEALEAGRYGVENAYRRVVRDEGNPAAQKMLKEVFQIATREWRGLGAIADSALALSADYADLDAERRFPATAQPAPDEHGCIAAELLRGVKSPLDCPHFGRLCTPEHPLGATMVSSEGVCAAFQRYR